MSNINALSDAVLTSALGMLDSHSLISASAVSRRLALTGRPLVERALERETQIREVESVRRRLHTSAYVAALDGDDQDDSDNGNSEDDDGTRSDGADEFVSRRDRDRQAAFDAGFRASAAVSYRVSQWRGVVQTLHELCKAGNTSVTDAPAVSCQASDSALAGDAVAVDSILNACIARLDHVLLALLRPNASGLAARACQESARTLGGMQEAHALRDNARAAATLEPHLQVDLGELRARVVEALRSVHVSSPVAREMLA